MPLYDNYDKENERRKSLKYSDVILGIIDIMGYKAFIEEYKEKAPVEIYLLIEMLLRLTNGLENFKFSILSDTIIIYTEKIDKNSLYNMILALEICRVGLIQKGFFSRGAIVKGEHFLKNNVMVSPAFIKAYEIEQNICVYPRIIIEESIIKDVLEINNLNKIKRNKNIYGKIIIRDFDLNFIINPLIIYLKFMQYEENSNILVWKLTIICDGLCLAYERARNNKEKIKARYFINIFNNYIDNFPIQVEKQYLKILKNLRIT